MNAATSQAATTTPGLVSTLDPITDPRWDEFVRHQPNGLIYHHSAWLRCLREEYSQPESHLAYVSGDRILGILPLLQTRGSGIKLAGFPGPRLASLPRTPFAGPLAVSLDVERELIQAAVNMAVSLGRPLQLKWSPWQDSAASQLSAQSWRPTYYIELPPDPTALRFGNGRNDGRLRWSVGRAARMGVRVREADSTGDLQTFYGLYLHAMRKHLVPPRPFRFFAACWDTLRPPDMLRLILAERRVNGRDVAIAATLCLLSQSVMHHAFSAASDDGLATRANDAVHAHAIRLAVEIGLRIYDLGETPMADAGLRSYKSKWASHTATLYRHYYPSAGPSDGDPFCQSKPGVGLARWLWRRLPLPATTAAGDWIYAHL